MTRREFAAASASLLAGLAVASPALSSLLAELRSDKMTAELISERTEHLPGGMRTVMVVGWSGLEGYKGQQTTTMTKHSIEGGELIEYDVTFTPPLLAPRAKKTVDRLHARYEFRHGPVVGDSREDTMIISGVVGTDALQPVTHRVRRPLNPTPAAGSSAEQLQRGLELIKQHGAGQTWPRVAGANEVLDWRPGERPGF